MNPGRATPTSTLLFTLLDSLPLSTMSHGAFRKCLRHLVATFSLSLVWEFLALLPLEMAWEVNGKICSKEMKTMSSQNPIHEFYSNLIGNNQIWKQPTCHSRSKWVNSAISVWRTRLRDKQEATADSCNDLNSSGGRYAEWQKSASEGHTPYSSICMIFSKGWN